MNCETCGLMQHIREKDGQVTFNISQVEIDLDTLRLAFRGMSVAALRVIADAVQAALTKEQQAKLDEDYDDQPNYCPNLQETDEELAKRRRLDHWTGEQQEVFNREHSREASGKW